MYCTKCGRELGEPDLFCSQCGTASRPAAPPAGAAPRLSRPMDQKSIAGVCAGFARYFGVDVILMRIVWLAVAILTGGLGVLVYIAAWLVMPKDYPAVTSAQRASQAV